MKKDKRFVWTDEAQQSFDALKVALTTLPMLAMPNDIGDFVLDTDASDHAIGAVLSQVQGGAERVIAYASRTLDRRERNYCVTRKELLAVVHCLKYFKQYLLGRSFKVRTDHAALTWLRRTPDPIGQQARWLEVMEEFNFIVEHRPGARHSNADAVSRRPCPKKDCACRETVASAFPGPADQLTSIDRPSADVSDAECLQVSAVAKAVPGGEQNQLVETLETMGPLWSLEGIRTAQRDDPDVGFILGLLETDSEKPVWNDISSMSKEVKALWSYWPRLAIKDSLLQRRYESHDGKKTSWQVVLPKELRQEFLSLVHGGMSGGHLGQKKTSAALQMRAYWPTWSSDLAAFLKKCAQCAQYHRGTLPRRAEMQTPRAGEPWERISIDITGPHPQSTRHNRYILTIVDHFSKWAEAVAIPNHTAATIARVLVTQVFTHFGAPVQLLTDRGREFESELFLQLMKWMEIEKLRTTAYKPSTNGIVERFHRTLNSMIGKVVSDSQRDWDERLPLVMAAYRASPHSSTGYTPNRLFLGRENRMPVDLAMGLPPSEVNGDQTIDDYVAKQQELASETYQLVRENLRVNAERRKVPYDVRVRKPEFGIGDWVWYYYPRRYTQKSPKWQRCYTGPYLIIRAIPPVNFVLQKTCKSQPFVVHADKLKKCYNPMTKSWLTSDGATDDREHAAEGMLTHDRRPPVDHLTDNTQHGRRRTTGHGLRTEHDGEEKRKARGHVREHFASVSSLENDASVGVRTDGGDECIDVSNLSGVNGSPRDRAELPTLHVSQGSNPMIRQWGERQRKLPTYLSDYVC